MSLQKFVDEQNLMAPLFNEPLIDLNALDQKIADAIFSRLDSNLSPEFLFADGERSRSKAMALKRKYEKAIKELVKKGFRPTVTMYSYTV